MSDITTIRLATYPEHAGKVSTHVILGRTIRVLRVAYGTPHEIHFRKYTADYKRVSSRQFKTAQSSFGTLEAALESIARQQQAPSLDAAAA